MVTAFIEFEFFLFQILVGLIKLDHHVNSHVSGPFSSMANKFTVELWSI